jgi:PAS domain S-box-containing protein
VIEWANPAFTVYTGYNVAEVIGKTPGLLKSGKHDEKFYRNLWGTISSGNVWHGEMINRRKDGSFYNEEMTITPIRDGQGEIEHFIAVMLDITERKKIEAQFLRAQRMESIGMLAGGIAHDLNNILAPIMMCVDILKSDTDSPQTKQILETVEMSAKRGADIVRQVLSFARGVEGERVEIQPKHLLRDLEKIIMDTFPKDIRLEFSIPVDTWTVLGDPTQLHQILLNLCVNARDAMPNGGTLAIGVENCVFDEQYAAMNLQTKPGSYVCISATDTGTGIPPEILDKIFDPFFTTKELNKGTGLGLSTVMAIVKSHEGTINVYSEPGKGTTFKIYLAASELSTDGRKQQSLSISLPRGHGETVLVVDDEASILTITSQTLQAFGYRVLRAMDGAEALAVYAEHQREINVVLTDTMMPVLDGPATIHAMMRINPSVKIIAASGLNANGNVAKAAGAGVKHFLTKPYTAHSLLKTIRSVLDEK